MHLHVHSDYSLLDGACRIDRLMKRAGEMGMKALALTDHGNLYGAIEFYNHAKSHGLKPLIGCEIYLAAGSRLEKTGRTEEGKSYYHMGLLARNLAGYRNLLKLVSDAHLRGFYYKPRSDLETLARHAAGLIGFTGCLAAIVPQHLLAGRWREAREATARFVDIFGRENFFVELQDHGIPEQRRIIPALLKLAAEFDLQVVCTNDVHYVAAADAKPHDALLCIQTGAKIADRDRLRFDTAEFYLKSRAEMERLFAEVPEAVVNTLAVAEMCDLAIPFPKGYERYPKYPLPVEVAARQTPGQYLHGLCVEGLRQRYGHDYSAVAARPHVAERLARLVDLPAGQKPQPPDYGGLAADEYLAVRLAYELAIIGVTGFVDYFLVVWDFIAWAKRRGIPVGPGRGSGAGCLVAYLLGITNVDPIRFGLLFERFLNPERVSPPDFDIDFCMRRRGEVIDYVRQKYGQDCVANIVTYGTLGAKMVIRDVARVHDLPFAEADRLAKMIPDELNISLREAIDRSAELRDELARNPVAQRIVDQALVLEGMVRNTGKHAAGIIICDRPLEEFVPLTLQEGDVTVQFEMKAVEKVGLLKADFLGLKTLTVIADAVEHVRRTADPRFDIDAIPLDDPATYALLNTGRTVGVFQLESPGMQNACRAVGVDTIDDINAISALYRPGPMQFIPDYARGKKDPATISFPHPLLEPILRETFGIIVYQEQVMECARVIAGYTLGGADMLRRAMGKKDAEAMAKERVKFVEGAKRTNGIAEKQANEIFDLLNKFASYGFNKSHSAAYALIAYQTAYLKANYPVQFMAALLGSELGNAEKVAHFIDEAQTMGIEVLGPDLNESRESFTPVVACGERGGKIRFGFAGIKGVGEAAAQKIVAERDARGPFRDLAEFLLRVDSRALNKRVLECLVLTGTFDSTGQAREEAFESIDTYLGALGELQRKYPALRSELPAAAAPAEPAAHEPMLLELDLGPATVAVPDPVALAAEFAAMLRLSAPRRPGPGVNGHGAENGARASVAAAPAPAERSLFELADAPAGIASTRAAPPAANAAAERRLDATTRLQFEKELLGFYVSGHPLHAFGSLVEAIASHPEDRLLELPDRAEFRLAGIAGNITKKLSKRDNRPWAAFTLSTLRQTVALNLYADAYEAYASLLEPERPLVAIGTVLRSADGARLNVKELAPLAPHLVRNVRRIVWVLRPDDARNADFLPRLRTALDRATGDTRIEIGFLFEDDTLALAETSGSMNWKLDPAAFVALRKHPAVLGAIVETKPIELKETRRRGARAR